MALGRTKLIGVGVAVLILAGGAAYVLTSGEQPVIQLQPASNVLRFEAAGIDYAGWPEMGVSVNGQEIGKILIDSAVRTMFTIDVPASVGEVETVEIKFLNETICQNPYFGSCTLRQIIVRGMYLNDEKIEGAEASGKDNMPSLIRTSEGGVVWKVKSPG